MKDYIIGLRAQQRLIIGLVAFFGMLSGIGTLVIGFLEYNRQSQQHLLHAPQIFHSSNADPAYAVDKPEARIPPLAR